MSSIPAIVCSTSPSIAARLPSLALVRPYKEMRDYFRILVAANLILLPLAILAFGERFDFWQLPLSDLGIPRTQSGRSNYVSMLIFDLYMLTGGFAMILYARSCRRRPDVPHSTIKLVLGLLAAAGYFIGIFPHDRFHALHTAGCSAMVGSLWLLGNIFSLELWNLNRRRGTLISQLILQLTVLPYAAAYFVDSGAKQTLQKFAVAGLFVSLSLATRLLRDAVLENATRLTGWQTASPGGSLQASPAGSREESRRGDKGDLPQERAPA